MFKVEDQCGLLPTGKSFTCNTIPVLEVYFPIDCMDLGRFKLLKPPEVKSDAGNNSIGNILCLVLDSTGPIWISLILGWSKPFHNAAISNDIAHNLLPCLDQGQALAEQAFITSHSLTYDNEIQREGAISKINKAHDLIHVANTIFDHPNLNG